MASPADATPVRDAATVILVRDWPGGPAVLMGQRGATAAFMASKFVFPGGAVDPSDAAVVLSDPVDAAALTLRSSVPASAIAAAAIRELWEETGLILGQPAVWPDAPPGWTGFAATGHRPDPSALRFVFRAVTPPGRPRRFDARFFLAPASALACDPDDLTRAGAELSHLAWVPIHAARRFDLPFVTDIVLAEIAARLPDMSPPRRVPFLHHPEGAHRVDPLESAGTW